MRLKMSPRNHCPSKQEVTAYVVASLFFFLTEIPALRKQDIIEKKYEVYLCFLKLISKSAVSLPSI